jgi:HlyD family secretion protein
MDKALPKLKWHQKRSVRLIGAGGIILIALWAFVFQSLSAGPRIPAGNLTISEVTEGEFQELIPATGLVQPLKSFYLDAVEGGRVAEIFVEDGQDVQVGQPILRLENTNLVLDVMYREAQLYEQSNNLRNTRLALEQQKLTLQMQIADIGMQLGQKRREMATAETLHVKGLVPEQSYQDNKDQISYLERRYELTVQSARQDSTFRTEQILQLENSVARLQSNLNVIRQNQDELTVRAPISGQLSALNAEIGQTRTAGQRLGQIDVLDSFKIKASIDEHYLERVFPGKTASMTLGDHDWKLRVKKIYPEVRNGQFDVDFAFLDSVPDGIRRGQSVRMKLALSDPGTAIMLPRGGFYNATGGQWVFLLDKDGKHAEKRPIKLGRQNLEVFEVIEGLRPGDQVITSEYNTFTNNTHFVIGQ